MTYLDIDTDPIQRYLEFTRKTALYPREHLVPIPYVALGLVGEAGEVANQVKKIIRDDGGVLTTDRRLKILDEIGDVCWYLFRLLDECGISFWEALDENRSKLNRRRNDGTIQGDRRAETG